jgi:hypothetical protein
MNSQNGHQPYDPWGLPVQDSSISSLEHSAPTPEEQTALYPRKTSSLVSKLPKSNKFRSYMFIGGALVGAWSFGFLINLASRSTQTIPQAIELEPQATEEEVAPEPPPLDDLASRRARAWEEVQQSCGVALPAIAAEVDAALTAARADSWKLYAKQQCDENEDCQSNYDRLRQHLDYKGGKIQEITLADRLPTKSKPARDFRQNLAELTDISKALSSGVSVQSLSWVPADRLNKAIDACSSDAKSYESLTRAAAREATAIPGGAGNGF